MAAAQVHKMKAARVHRAACILVECSADCGGPSGAAADNHLVRRPRTMWTRGGRAVPLRTACRLPLHDGARDPRKPLYTPTLCSLGHPEPRLVRGQMWGGEKPFQPPVAYLFSDNLSM